MQEKTSENIPELETPVWYIRAINELSKQNASQLLIRMETLKLDELTALLGGSITELSHEQLRILFPEGSEDEEVASILREKRSIYLQTHQDEEVSSNAARGVIAYDGRFIPWNEWKELPLNKRLAVTVGLTCFHYAGDVPGYGD